MCLLTPRRTYASALDMLAQLRSETVETVVLEAIRLVLLPTQRDLGIVARLLRLLEECPRLVANCAEAVVELLCSQDFLEVAIP